MHRAVHSRLHRIEIMDLVRQLCIIVRNHQRIHRSENNRDTGSHRVHGILTKIKKPGKVLRSDICGRGTLLHLLIATLHSICASQRRIVEPIRIKEAISALTVCKHNMNALVMVVLYSVLQRLTSRARATGRVAKSHPWNACTRKVGPPRYTKYRFWTEPRGRRGCHYRCRSHRRLPTSTYLNLARSQQYTANQHSGKNNQALPFHIILYLTRDTLLSK